MNSPFDTPRTVADELRRICSSPQGEGGVEAFVLEILAAMPEDDRAPFLKALLKEFEAPKAAMPSEFPLPEVFARLLGKPVGGKAVPPEEMLLRLSEALATLFETLNRIVETIDGTLLGEAAGGQTIRTVIGSRMAGTEGRSIEEYLGHIEKAFMVSHSAFRQAAHTLFARILAEMSPDKIAAGADSRLKFGPMRKAEYYDLYEAGFATLKTWFESGRFMNDLLKEFEKNCQTSVS